MQLKYSIVDWYWKYSVEGYKKANINVPSKKSTPDSSQIKNTEGIHHSPIDPEPLWNSIRYQINRKMANTIYFLPIQHESEVYFSASTK